MNKGQSFDDLDKSMRIYETNHDHCVLPGINIVVRLDGKGFTKLTRDKSNNFEAPFDARFSDLMKATTRYLMKDTGFRFIYGYTQSDEISLLLHKDDNTFNRKTRKLNSVLASAAGAFFSLRFGSIALFDCRVIELPGSSLVGKYFYWRQEDATRNSLNAWCYWTLRGEGLSARQATSKLEHASISQKNEMLFQRNINFNDIPLWQKRGIGFYWENVEIEGFNPITKQSVTALRNRLFTNPVLERGDEYMYMVTGLAENGGNYLNKK